MSYFVYILRTSSNTLYIGQTNNLKRRLEEHRNNKTKSAKYIRYFPSFDLVYSETYPTRKESMQRELQLKKWSRVKKEALITGAKATMEAKDVIEIIQLLEKDGINVWLDGGWGVDALLEKQTRPHKDVDVIVRVDNAQKMQTALARQGFTLVDGGVPSSFVLRDQKGRKIDVHPVRFDEQGNGIYRMQNGKDWVYSADGFTGRGKIDSREIRCLTAKTQMLCHAGYKLGEKDFREMDALHQRFGVEYPEQYKKRSQ